MNPIDESPESKIAEIKDLQNQIRANQCDIQKSITICKVLLGDYQLCTSEPPLEQGPGIGLVPQRGEQ